MMRVSELAQIILSKFPAVHERLLDLRYSNLPLPSHKHQVIGDDSEAVFNDIFRCNRWNDGESVSGVGSNSRYTRNVRRALPKLMRKYNLRSILDAPCGDFAWMQNVTFNHDIMYSGGDIVRELVERLQRDFASPRRAFMHLDVISMDLPKADLWLCRDCFIHLSNAQVFEAFKNFMKADIKYILTTSYNFGRVNADITTGQFRAINLQAAPFSLPQPLETIVDYIYPFPPRRLALWSKDQILAWWAARENPGR